MSQTNTSMNFLPEDYVEKRQAARAAVVFIGLLLAVVGGIVGSYLYTQWNMKGIFQKRDQVSAALADASTKIPEAEELKRQKGRMTAKWEITTTLVEPVPRSTLLAELARKEVRPQGVNFVSIELKSRPLETPQAAPPSDLEKARRAEQGLPAAKAPTMDVTVDLVGTAATDADVSAYMAALQKSPLLTGVTLLYSEEFRKNKEDPALRRFNFEMHINPEAGLRVGGVATALPKN